MLDIKTGFSQWLAGYTGRRLDQRGKHLEREQLWRIDEVQDLFSQWVALEWQQTPHGGLRSPYTPGLVLSPNQMYAAQIARCGYRALPLTERENHKLLPAVWVTVNRKGFTVNNRTYNCDALDPCRRRSGITGRRSRWEVHYNPYRPDVAWLFDHRAHDGEDPWVEVPFVYRRLLNDP